MESRLVTLREAEAMTGRKVSSWRKDILRRRIAFVKLGKSVRIPVSEIERLVNAGWHAPVTIPDPAVSTG